MKKIVSIMAVLMIGLPLIAANVVTEYSGPSGQGDMIIVAPATGVTNAVFTTNGITAGKIAGACIVDGSITAAKIDPTVVTNVLSAGMALPAVDGSAVTNIQANQITNGNLAVARITNALATGAGTVLGAFDGTAVTTAAAKVTGNLGVAQVTNVLKTTGANLTLAAFNAANLTNAITVGNVPANGWVTLYTNGLATMGAITNVRVFVTNASIAGLEVTP